MVPVGSITLLRIDHLPRYLGSGEHSHLYVELSNYFLYQNAFPTLQSFKRVVMVCSVSHWPDVKCITRPADGAL